MPAYPLVSLLSLLAGIVLGGTVFFRFIEGWSWLDAYFFTVVTLSTVGYGNLVPVTVLGKIGTTVLIFVGLGVFALAIQQVAAYTIRRRKRPPNWLERRLGRRRRADTPPSGKDEGPSE